MVFALQLLNVTAADVPLPNDPIIVFLIAVAISVDFLWQRADKERIKSQNLLVKNYRSNAFYSKEQNNWLKVLHFSAKVGELATTQT